MTRHPVAVALATLVLLLTGASSALAVVSPTSPGNRSQRTTAGPAATTPTPTPALGIEGAPIAPVPVAPVTEENEGGGTPGGPGNWMAANGLRSPLCERSRAQSCEGSGTVTIPVPPGHYKFDEWIEGGTLGMPTWPGIVSSVLGFLWSLIVQATVAVFSVLEWAMAFNLTEVGGGALSRVHLINESWGRPIAAVMLAIGAIWVGIQSMSQRKIGGALASVASGFLTMGLSLAVLANPAGTIGKLTDLTADLGRVAAAAPLKIAMPNTPLEEGMRQTWQVIIERPFALLEFGDTEWGTDPEKLDPELLDAARRIAREQGRDVVRQVNAARTNAGLFAVWAANSDERNSRKKDKCEDGPCLLNVMCGGQEDLEDCKGSMAKYVKARTEAGVDGRVQQVVLIGLGMIAVWLVFGAIAVGLLWSFVSIVKNMIVLAYLWVLAMTFKPEWRRKPVDVLLKLVGSAMALIVFGIAAGIALTMFLVVQSLGLPWAAQWVLSLVALVGLFMERSEISGLMKALLTQPDQTAGGASGFASRLASSYATGVGLGALRGKRPAGTAAGAAAGMGGGLPTELPNDPSAKTDAEPQGRPSRETTAAAAALAGVVAGPLGSAVAAGLVQRAAIAGGAKTAGGAALGAAQTLGGPVVAAASSAATVLGAMSGPGDSADGVLEPADQVQSLLEGQRAFRLEQAQAAAEALPGAENEVLAASQQHADAVRELLGADPEAPRETLMQAATEAGERQEHAAQRVELLRAAVERGEQVQAWTPDDASSPAAQRAAGWLDSQATTPAQQRSYGQLAAMHGVTPAQWSSMPDEGRQELRSAIDGALALRTPAVGRRPSPLEALGHVASQQPWWNR